MGITTGSESEQAVKAKRLKGPRTSSPTARTLSVPCSTPRRHAPPPPTAPCASTATHGRRSPSSTRRRPPSPNAFGPNRRRRAAIPLPQRAAGPFPRTPLARISDAGPLALLDQRQASTPSAWPPVLTPVVPRPTRCRWACATANCAHPRSSPTPGLRHSQLRPPTLLLTPDGAHS
ncbi:hypothetical protein GQ55_2G323100 [Panicum hallii var. hallii]|uniref:Uncharacterized protein n=1 Tax=Panicum hallii var. hallii TaxID=1504633 RepID=A0A2T7EUQ4_9POAL|nr:hypothetical protein GQ55_2G323100 [Panicum hallii var. hallii]